MDILFGELWNTHYGRQGWAGAPVQPSQDSRGALHQEIPLRSHVLLKDVSENTFWYGMLFGNVIYLTHASERGVCNCLILN